MNELTNKHVSKASIKSERHFPPKTITVVLSGNYPDFNGATEYNKKKYIQSTFQIKSTHHFYYALYKYFKVK